MCFLFLSLNFLVKHSRVFFFFKKRMLTAYEICSVKFILKNSFIKINPIIIPRDHYSPEMLIGRKYHISMILVLVKRS